MSSQCNTCLCVKCLALDITCKKVSPLEYAYHGDSVNRVELPGANCRMYPTGIVLPGEGFSEEFIHCNGTQLRLSDSDKDIEQTTFQSYYYYEWSAGTKPRQLLFIFSTRVIITNVTLPLLQ